MGYGYENIFTFYGPGFPSPHLDMPGLGQGFRGCNRWILLTIITYPSKPLNAEFSFPISTSDFRIPTSNFKIYPSYPIE
jgi:hypothetical protein